MGVFYREKGIRKRKTKRREKGLGRKRESSKDTRVESREIRFYTKRGIRTRRMWISEEPLPIGERQ